MMYFHPFLQGILIVVMIFAWMTGMAKLRPPRPNDNRRFNRKRHVLIGKTATGGMLLGIVVGLGYVYALYGAVLVTGLHGILGAAVVPLIVTGIVTGAILEKNSHKHPYLSKAHGGLNALALGVCAFQIRTGLELLLAMMGK